MSFLPSLSSLSAAAAVAPLAAAVCLSRLAVYVRLLSSLSSVSLSPEPYLPPGLAAPPKTRKAGPAADEEEEEAAAAAAAEVEVATSMKLLLVCRTMSCSRSASRVRRLV